MLIIALLILVGCKRASITPTGTTIIEQPQENIEDQTETEDVSDETILEETEDDEEIEESEINDSESNTTEVNDDEEPIVTLPEGTHIVAMQMAGTNMVFFPKELKISLGETIRWENRLDYLNKTTKLTVYSYQHLFRSSDLEYGEYFEYTFTEKGTFRYNALPYIKIFKPGEIIVE